MNLNIIWGGLLCLIMAGCKAKSSLPYYTSAELTPIWDVDNTSDLHAIPDFSFTDQNNQTITQKNFNNKIYVANFFFTSCGAVCRKMTNNLHKVQQAFQNNPSIELISHTVTPWIDSVPKLKTYSTKYNMSNQWYLVTGDKGTIYQLARQGYFAEEAGFNKDSSEFLHTERVLLIDKNRHIRGVYNGTLPLEIERMIADMELLLKE